MVTSWIGMALVIFQLYLFSRNDDLSKWALPVNVLACIFWGISAVALGDMALLILQFVLAGLAIRGIFNWFGNYGSKTSG